MLMRFLGCGAVFNISIALVCGMMLYSDRSDEALIYLLAGFGLGWWGILFLGFFLLCRARVRKPQHSLFTVGGWLLLLLCGAAFVFATLGNSNAPTVLLTFGGGSLVVAGAGCIVFWGVLDVLGRMLSSGEKEANEPVEHR